jgi:putative tryptophan/tyrosine transport system substrate-binding protein
MAIRIARRDFIAALGSAAVWPLAARAQQSAPPVIGFLRNTSAADSADLVASFKKGLNEAGLIEGQSFTIEYRWAESRYDRLPGLVAGLVGLPVAVIMASGNASALAAKAATTTIPIVFSVGEDPVQIGLVTSLNRPEENLTGTSFLAAVTLVAKRLELICELLPDASTIAYLTNPNNPIGGLELYEAQKAAQALGRRLIVLSVRSDLDLDGAFANLVQQSAKALLVSADALHFGMRDQIVALAAHYAVPAAYVSREFVKAGGLMSYGTSLTDAHRQSGIYAGRILKGAKPADLPVLLPTKFDLVINLKTAKALGLTVPPKLLVTADEVIE